MPFECRVHFVPLSTSTDVSSAPIFGIQNRSQPRILF